MRCHSVWPCCGAEFHTDVPSALGGKGEYPPPPSLLAAAVASCMLSMLAWTGEQKGFPTAHVRIHSGYEEDKSGIRSLHFHIIVPGDTASEVRRLMEHAVHHCPVGSAIDQRVEKHISWEWGEKSCACSH